MPRVLLAEDNEVNAYLVRYVLEREGFDVDVVGDGRAALEVARIRPPDLVLMDIRMPVLDGYEATVLFKSDATLAGVPVVALSANAMPDEKERALACGCVAHVEKPIDVTTFAAQVRSLLAGGA